MTADAYNYAESDEGFDLYHCHSCGYLVSSCAYCWDEDLRSDGCAQPQLDLEPSLRIDFVLEVEGSMQKGLVV